MRVAPRNGLFMPGGTVQTHRSPDVATVRREAVTEALRNIRGVHVVYYIDCGDSVKIGTSRDLPERMRRMGWKVHDLLALEPGSYDVEAERLSAFASTASPPPDALGAREWFAKTPMMEKHINSLRLPIGLPPLDWF